MRKKFCIHVVICIIAHTNASGRNDIIVTSPHRQARGIYGHCRHACQAATFHVWEDSSPSGGPSWDGDGLQPNDECGNHG